MQASREQDRSPQLETPASVLAPSSAPSETHRSPSQQDRQQQQPAPNASTPAYHRRLRGGRPTFAFWQAFTTLLLLLVVVAGGNVAVAVGPPTNPLNVFTRFDVAWVNAQTGEFGGNLTFFRSMNAAPANGWALTFRFPSARTTVVGFNSPKQWALASDGAGSVTATCNVENIASPDSTPALVASDSSNGLKRYSLFVNGKVAAPATAKDLFPTSFSMRTPGSSKVIQLVDQKDFANTPLQKNVPTKPFGAFLSTSNALAVQAAASAAAAPVPSPNGTDLVVNTGLFVFSTIFVIAASVFTYGTIGRAQYASAFRSQSYSSKASAAVAPATK